MEDNAPFFDLPNSQNPLPHSPMKYGDQHVPHPTNSLAKKVDAAKVMMQVMDAK